ncbi:MAG TPA: iron-sulfur cluster assembly scaffold protein [Patescibacteria group bacterium]
MQDPLYRELILEHWQNPQNYGIVKNADFDVSDNNPLCGDEIRITGKIKDGKLMKIAFTGDGCAISKASASLFTEKIKERDVSEIEKITPEEVLAEIGLTLTPARMKCALLVYKTVEKITAFRESSIVSPSQP